MDKPVDKKKVLRQTDHLTRPPRLQPTVKNAMMDKVLKKKKPHPLIFDGRAK